MDAFAQSPDSQVEPTVITIPYDDSSGEIVLPGQINLYRIKAYFTVTSTLCTISSIQASLLLHDGVIKQEYIKGEVNSGTVSVGSRITIPRLYLGRVPFSNVRFVVSDNASFPITVSYKLLEYKGRLYVDPDSKEFIMVSVPSGLTL